ncbi:MAG: hypothetical protein LBV67_10900 [Streptococcaceae bacterium]|jgi:hypothetical protein|nr:hypothetical protein [Streptococcaceae bacterium]
MLPHEHFGSVYQQHHTQLTHEAQVLDECSNIAYIRVCRKYGYMSDDQKKLFVIGMTTELIAQREISLPQEQVKNCVEELFG